MSDFVDRKMKMVEICESGVISYRNLAYKIIIVHAGLLIAIALGNGDRTTTEMTSLIISIITIGVFITWWMGGLLYRSRQLSRIQWDVLTEDEDDYKNLRPEHPFWVMGLPVLLFPIVLSVVAVIVLNAKLAT